MKDGKIVNSTEAVTTMSVKVVTGDAIVLQCETMPGNQPASYGNFIAIWQNSDQVPWNQEPLKRQYITKDTSEFSVNFDGLDLTENSYILGYSVGPLDSNICTTAAIPRNCSDPSKCKLFSTSVSLSFVGTTSLFVKYETPAGYRPESNRNWVGIWRGTTVPYDSDPLKKDYVKGDENIGSVGINNIDLKRGTTYTVGYFMGKKQTFLAASHTFTV